MQNWNEGTNNGIGYYSFMDRRYGKLVIGSAIFASFVIVSAVLITTNSIDHARAYPYDRDTGNYSFGTISSIQNDENGDPAWVVFGHWKSNLASNQSLVEAQGNESLGGSFDAQFEMVRFNGSSGHTHTLTSFVASNSSQVNNSTVTFNGTTTASTREGPVTDIPSSITITGDKVISIWLDPSKISNHYGNTPIYGLVMDRDEDRQPMLKSNSTQISR